MKDSKTIYIGACFDIIHKGHINIIKQAQKYGNFIIIGLLTDDAMKSYKGEPLMAYEDRKYIIENIKGVNLVVPQETLDYVPNIIKYQPDYLIHGDDWKDKKSPQFKTRKKVIDTLKKIGAKLIEVPYTTGISSSGLKREIR